MPSSRAVVVQRVIRILGALDARDSTQIFVNSAQVMVTHVLKGGPWHDLESAPLNGNGRQFVVMVAEQVFG